jgi:Apea-like HEPN
LGFKIPFVIRLTNNIFDRPERSPNLETLETELYFDQITNEEIGEQPSRYISLDEDQTRTLEQCLKRVDAMLSNIEPFLASWSFLKIGLGFLGKGFFARGLEQLLWHITALEALFGEDRPGLTQLMARRVALVLGETEAQQRDISNRFEELYKLRSKLVHGSELKGEVWEGQLKVARDLARRSLLWFLSFLEEFSKVGKRSPSAMFAERKELLAVIDSRAEAIIQLAKLLKSVPQSFPAVKAWQEPWVLHR